MIYFYVLKVQSLLKIPMDFSICPYEEKKRFLTIETLGDGNLLTFSFENFTFAYSNYVVNAYIFFSFSFDITECFRQLNTPPLLNADSKTLKEEKREELFGNLKADESIGWAVDVIDPRELSAKMLKK